MPAEAPTPKSELRSVAELLRRRAAERPTQAAFVFIPESDAVTRDAEFVKRMGEIGLEPIGNSPAEFQQRLREDLATWQRVTRQMNVQPE